MADLLTIDEIDLHGQGFGAATRSGRYGVPARRGENTILAGSSGSDFVPNRPYEEGTGALVLWAIGATTVNGNISIPSSYALQRQQFETNMQTLMRLFTRGHRLSTIRAAQADGTIRRAQVEWREWSEPEIQAAGTRAEWGIAYTIPKVWWEDESATVQASNPSASLPHTLNLTNFDGMTGVIEDAQFDVLGPITNPRITDLETGAWVQYSGSVGAGSTWTVNVGTWASTVLGNSVLGATTHNGGYRFLTIPNCYGLQNHARLTLSGTGASSATKMTVTARRKWAHG